MRTRAVCRFPSELSPGDSLTWAGASLLISMSVAFLTTMCSAMPRASKTRCLVVSHRSGHWLGSPAGRRRMRGCWVTFVGGELRLDRAPGHLDIGGWEKDGED